jgi:hypothetical protein
MQKTPSKRNIILAAAALCLLAAVFLTAFHFLRPSPAEGEKNIRIDVIVDGETVRTVSIDTDEGYLLPVLLEHGLVTGEDGAWGFWVTSVNGITPDESNDEWWKLYINGEMSVYPPDQLVIGDGDVVGYVLTVGFDEW